MRKTYSIYREWVYKIFFYFFNQLAASFAAIFTGDMLKVWKGDPEFKITIEEVKNEKVLY